MRKPRCTRQARPVGHAGRIDECFFHCGKALLRSDIWNAASWPSPVTVSFGEEIAENLMPPDEARFNPRNLIAWSG